MSPQPGGRQGRGVGATCPPGGLSEGPRPVWWTVLAQPSGGKQGPRGPRAPGDSTMAWAAPQAPPPEARSPHAPPRAPRGRSGAVWACPGSRLAPSGDSHRGPVPLSWRVRAVRGFGKGPAPASALPSEREPGRGSARRAARGPRVSSGGPSPTPPAPTGVSSAMGRPGPALGSHRGPTLPHRQLARAARGQQAASARERRPGSRSPLCPHTARPLRTAGPGPGPPSHASQPRWPRGGRRSRHPPQTGPCPRLPSLRPITR